MENKIVVAKKQFSKVTKQVALKSFNKGKMIICKDSSLGFDIVFSKDYQHFKDSESFNYRGAWYVEN